MIIHESCLGRRQANKMRGASLVKGTFSQFYSEGHFGYSITWISFFVFNVCLSVLLYMFNA